MLKNPGKNRLFSVLTVFLYDPVGIKKIPGMDWVEILQCDLQDTGHLTGMVDLLNWIHLKVQINSKKELNFKENRLTCLPFEGKMLEIKKHFSVSHFLSSLIKLMIG